MREIYKEILTFPHHTSLRHTPMSAESRAAKFAAFKALDGHEDKISETARETERSCERTEEERDRLNNQLYSLLEHRYEDLYIGVCYFEPDKKKDGGAFIYYEGTFKYYRDDVRCYVFTDGFELPVEKIVEVEIIQ